ncbi:MAG: protoporphyrinogen oxidase, partial [Candidatus Eisenbacteria bacterium]
MGSGCRERRASRSFSPAPRGGGGGAELEGGGNIQDGDHASPSSNLNGFPDNAETPRLARQLERAAALPAGDAAATRYIYVRGKLRPVPLAPPAFLFSDILTVSGRLRVLMEPMIPARPDFNESVYNFAARRIGPEAASVLVDSMVAGVYAGDSRALELGSCFLKLHTLERDYGGLIRGMIASRKAARAKAEAEARAATRTGEAKKQKSGGPAGPGGVLTSFDRGMQVLTQTLVAVLREEGAALRLGSSAVTLARIDRAARPDQHTEVGSPALAPDARWRLRLSSGEQLDAHTVVMAAPPEVAADLLEASDPAIATPLRAIPGSPLAVVGLAFDRAQLRRPVNGFGFLVAKGPGAPRCLGVLWDSAIYRGRAPEGSVLMRAMIGGARDPQVVEWDDARLLSQIADDLRLTMGIDAVPRRTWVFR